MTSYDQNLKIIIDTYSIYAISGSLFTNRPLLKN